MFRTAHKKTVLALTSAILAIATPALAQQHKTRYAYGSVSLSYLPIYLAEDLGYMKDFGVAIDTSVIKGGSGPAAAATLSGSIDFYVGLLFSAAPAVEKGQPLTGFATTLNQYGSTIVVSGEVSRKHNLTKATPIEERLNALKGLRVASFGPNSSSDLLIRFIAKRKGWNADTDMQLIPIGGAPALAAFEQKRIDALVHSSPLADVAVNKFGGNMIVNLAAGEYTPLADMPYITLVANGNWLSKNKETAARVTAAIWKAMDFAHARPEETRAILRKRFPSIDQDTYNASFDSSLVATPKTPAITPAMSQRAIDFHNEVARDRLTIKPQQLGTEEIVNMAAALRK